MALSQPALAHACTVCNSPAGRAVRAGLFNGHFLHTLLLVLLPFPVLAAIVLLLSVGMPDLRRPHPSSELRKNAFEPTPELLA